MAKLILMSILIAMIVIPVRASQAADAQEGLRTVIKQYLVFEVLYLLALRYLWGHFT